MSSFYFQEEVFCLASRSGFLGMDLILCKSHTRLDQDTLEWICLLCKSYAEHTAQRPKVPEPRANRIALTLLYPNPGDPCPRCQQQKGKGLEFDDEFQDASLAWLCSICLRTARREHRGMLTEYMKPAIPADDNCPRCTMIVRKPNAWRVNRHGLGSEAPAVMSGFGAIVC